MKIRRLKRRQMVLSLEAPSRSEIPGWAKAALATDRLGAKMLQKFGEALGRLALALGVELERSEAEAKGQIH